MSKRLGVGLAVLALASLGFAAPVFAGGGCGSWKTQTVSVPQPVDTAETGTSTPTASGSETSG